MYHIAIVEDEDYFAEKLRDFLIEYQKEQGIAFRISIFSGGAKLLAGYEPVYDMILLDIEMPKPDGMETAEQIRRMDPEVVLVFVTNMASYAIRGFEVGALDFIMKPITYDVFSMRLKRALKRVIQRQQKQILLNLPDGVKRLCASQIYYVEVQNRMLHYYTQEGEYVVRGTMAGASQILSGLPFVKCNHWYMVNLMHVTEVHKNMAYVGGHALEISRRSRTAFLKALTEYVGGMPWRT